MLFKLKQVMALSCVIVLLIVCSKVESARILAIFPSPAKSHQIVFRALVEGLLERGHQLTIMTPDPLDTINENVTQIDWSYAYEAIEEYATVAKATQEQWNALKVARQILLAAKVFVEAELSHPEVQAMIRDPREHFDVVLAEYFHFTPFYAFAELYNAPLIGITTIDAISYVHNLMGNVVNAACHPEMNHKFSSNLTFLQRVESLIARIFINYHLIPEQLEEYDRIIEYHFGGNVSRSSDLINRIELLLTNVEPVLGFKRPLVPQTIPLGFLHVKPPKQLPRDLKNYLDRSTRGVIYFSLGTLIRTTALNEKNLKIFVDVFKTLQYDVLWKCDAQIDLNGTSNVRLQRWLPQQDLLAHPNVKLFVTQGGQQSMEEAVDRHVPMVVIPFNFDQFGNSDKVVELGIGKSIWMERLTTDGLRQAIIEVISNKKYKRNIERLGKLVRDQPMRPVEKAVWWIEYVIRHQGASHLRYKPAQMPVWQYHYYDVVAFLLLVGLVLLALVAIVTRRFFRWLFGRQRWWSFQRKQKIL
ncbi:UDP-glucosyltransferase 2-like isoform X2 [Uranotaenia lowii]|uniref:UDP-glucosyltransferase 2-like isoform X2 n=1 Tax=Uranotaenia lowii TaxID=190385 RepID=UPI0024790D0D|nr:UDP-glucosyltransferase 2-like isoform X2 [Uranotaenia lowii]